ncbi:hypothetical protein ACWEDZ_26170 [Streptomyces sp. NPDC005047]
MKKITAACIGATAMTAPMAALGTPAAADDMSLDNSRALHATLDLIKVRQLTGATVTLDGNRTNGPGAVRGTSSEL